MSESYDVIVIGAGYGGATIAALLADAGRRVALVDKTPRAGGKTQTLDRKGYRYEMFGAVGIPALDSRFHELVERLDLGDEVELLFPEGPVAAMHYRTEDGDWRTFRGSLRPGSDVDVASLQALFAATDEEMEALANFYLALFMLSDEDIDVLDDVGTTEFLAPHGLSAGLTSQINATLNMLFVVPVDRLAASETVRCLRAAALSGSGRFHRGGYGQVAEACARFVVDHGGLFRTSTRVESIDVEDGRAIGVTLKDGTELRAPVVVSNAGIQPTVLKLTGAEHFPADYVERVRGLEPSWAIAGVRYVFDTRVFDAGLIPVFSDESWLDSERFAAMERGEWPDVPLIAIDVASEFDPGLVPVEGHQVANIQVFVPADPDSPLVDEAIARARATVEELYPAIREHTIRTEPYGPRQASLLTRDATEPGTGGEAVGLAQVVGQVGRNKPDPRTPLPGLYLVGCDAGGVGAGTHQAVDSGFNVAAMVLEDHPDPVGAAVPSTP